VEPLRRQALGRAPQRRASQAAPRDRGRGGWCLPRSCRIGCWRTAAARRGWMQMWPLALPWASRGTPRSDTGVSAGPGPASEGPGAGPSLISPARQDAKLEDLEGLSRRAATHRPSTMTVPA